MSLRALALGLLGGCLPWLAGCGRAGTAPGAAVAGTYEIDPQAYRTYVEQEFASVTGPKARKLDALTIDVLMRDLELVLVLAADGTWTLKGKVAEQVIDDAGTWELEEGAVRLRFTKRATGRHEVRTVTARLEPDGAILLRRSPLQPGPYRMVRR